MDRAIEPPRAREGLDAASDYAGPGIVTRMVMDPKGPRPCELGGRELGSWRVWGLSGEERWRGRRSGKGDGVDEGQAEVLGTRGTGGPGGPRGSAGKPEKLLAIPPGHCRREKRGFLPKTLESTRAGEDPRASPKMGEDRWEGKKWTRKDPFFGRCARPGLC